LKKSTFLLVAGLFSLLITSHAQQSPQRSCNVFEMQEAHFQQDPSARARYAQVQSMLEQHLRENPQARTQAIINVPVVVHVLLPAAQQAQVTDLIIQRQIDTLNFYYGGSPANSDSLRVYTPFRTTYGRSEIRFCLAQRTPANTATNGITRTVTSTIFDGTNVPGSVIVWPPTQYLNIWVVNGGSSGLLGYSYLPGTWAPSDNHQGFVNDYRAFGSGPGISSGGYHFNEYNGGKTAVHEIGHYFNLYHTWGPNNSGNPTCTLSDQCADTPPCDGPFFGCPTSLPVLDACSPSAPGVMWQNHMDYADDRCMILFTNEQCARMMTAITTAPDRVGLISSNGCQPPPVLNNDIRVSNIIFPVNNSTSVCNPVIPQVTVTNNGTNTVSSFRVNVALNGGAPVFVDFPSANLAAGGSTNLTLTTLPQNLVVGANTLKIYTSLPNGGVDAIPSNDTAYSTVTRTNGTNLPVVEGFESATFPPTGWTLNTGNTWIRTTPGFNSSFSSWANFWDFGTGTTLVLTTPTYSVAGSAGARISFDLSHWPFTTTTNDRLIVEVSNDCGNTFPSVLYDKTSNTGLSTVPGTSGLQEFIPSSNSQWRREIVTVPGAFVTPGTMNVRFRAISNFGNNIFIDNINIEKVFGRDLTVKSITRPGVLECGAFAPIVVVENVGLEAVSAFSVTYQVDGGAVQTQAFTVAIAPGGTATVTLNNVAAQTPGAHTINICTANPVTGSGTGDQNTLNDCRTKTFSVTGTIAAPLVEGFEGTFPPAGWAIANPDASLTWSKTTPGLGSTASAYVNNFNYVANGRVDELYSPAVTYSGVDSVTLSFDVAAATYTYPGTTGVPLDTLEVLVTKDCGNSFVSVWKKWGDELQTINDPNYPQTVEFIPNNPSHWRNERVDLTGLFTPNGPAQVVFRNTTNFENNIFVDNVNLTTRVLPNTLKEQGYLVLPNPFNDQFTVWHLLPPTNLRFISVYNSAGQLVWKKQFNGDATKQVTVDLTGKAAGTYVVNIGYSDRVRDTQVKVVKLR
jgi:hypothetical protein